MLENLGVRRVWCIPRTKPSHDEYNLRQVNNQRKIMIGLKPQILTFGCGSQCKYKV